MLRKLRIFYHSNKAKVWFTIGIIIFIYIIIRFWNAEIKIDNDKAREEAANNSINNSTVQTGPSTNTAVLSGTAVSDNTLKKDTEVIKQFIEACNAKNIDEAYSLLSEDCKNELYKTEGAFDNDYVKQIFNQNRSYDIQAWVTSTDAITYKIKYLDDIMATGVTNEEYIEEYITVIKEENDKKLNLSQFIKKDNINRIIKKGDLEVNIINRYIYNEYEEYELKFTNKGEKTINLDTKDKTDSVYIKDKNSVKYDWFGNEVPDEYLTLNESESRTFRIKFNKVYSLNKNDSKIYFTDVHIGNESNKINLEMNVQ